MQGNPVALKDLHSETCCTRVNTVLEHLLMDWQSRHSDHSENENSKSQMEIDANGWLLGV